MLNNYSTPIVLDATPAVQKPGGNGSRTGGKRDYGHGLCRAGSDLGIRNFFLYIHSAPDNAQRDGHNAIPLHDFISIVEHIVPTAV